MRLELAGQPVEAGLSLRGAVQLQSANGDSDSDSDSDSDNGDPEDQEEVEAETGTAEDPQADRSGDLTGFPLSLTFG